jgi:hypothetical protein
MPTRDVPRDQRADFLEQFSRRHRAWLATVEQSGDAVGRYGGGEAPLGSVTAKRKGLGEAVENPTSVRVRQSGDGAETALEITDEEGVRTRVAFRESAKPEMLDGMAPGEM